jgi:hypothetical protein
MSIQILNPGSPEALREGCLCPVIDNHYGKGVDRGNGKIDYWKSADCPLHGFDGDEKSV